MRYWKPRKISGTPQVGVGVATYLTAPDCHRALTLRSLIASFRAQTYPHWRMLVVHDGPTTADVSEFLAGLTASDPRVATATTPERKQKFGHPYRQFAVDGLAGSCEWLLLTNDDNYYVPVFLEWLVSEGERPPGHSFVHCDMVHSHQSWRQMTTRPARGKLDLGGFIVRSALAKQVPFDNTSFAGDGDWINRLAAKAKKGVRHVAATLFVHN